MKGRADWLSDVINGYFYPEVVGVLVPGKAFRLKNIVVKLLLLRWLVLWLLPLLLV